jgi:hypothetical protein
LIDFMPIYGLSGKVNPIKQARAHMLCKCFVNEINLS